MDPKLHASATSPPPKTTREEGRAKSPTPATPPRPNMAADSPLRRAVGASPRVPLSPRPVPIAEALLTVPAPIPEKGRKRPLGKTKSFVFSKSFDETKQHRRESAVWSPSHSSGRGSGPPRSPDSSLSGRQSIDEVHESVDELQTKLKKNSTWRDQYADLKRLHDLIGKIKKDYLHAEQEFAIALAAQVTKVEMFYRRLVGELQQVDRVFRVQYDPEELAKFIQNIEDFALLNTAIFKNVVNVHDLNSVLRLKPSYAWTIRRDDFCQPALLFPLFVQLSSIYHTPSSVPRIPITPAFRRSSPRPKGVKVSIWIPHNQVVAFIIKVLSHMPLYDPEMFAMPHTAVYFDDSEFKGYQSYVHPASGEATVTCFRWMGISPPNAAAEVYVDQKKVEGGRHTTKQIGTLPHSLVGSFLKSNPDEKNEELRHLYEENPGLATFKKNLPSMRPTLKVEHFRTWFGSEQLQIRLCTQLTILRELDLSQLNKLNEWTTPSERIQEQRIHRFPFALVTVLSQSLVLPNWLSEAVDKFDRQDRFSTYPHGMAMLYEKLSTQHGRPSWLSGALSNVFVKPLAQDEKTKEQTAAGYFKHSRSEMQFRTGELHRLRSHSVSEYMRTGSADFGSPGNNFELRSSDLSTYRSKQPIFRGGDQSMLPPITRTDMLVQGSPESPRDEKCEAEPEGHPLLPRRLETDATQRKKAGEKQEAQILGKRSAEHKTYFANERTYMQWFNASILLSTVGLALLNSTHYFLRIVAYCFPSMAILILFYAYRMYRLRIRTLDMQLPTSKFADMQGPCCLTTVVSILFLAVLIVMGVHDSQAPPYLYQANPAGLILQNPWIIASECDPGFSFPSPMKGLAYNSSSQDLWGVSDSQVFQLHTDTKFTYRFFPQDTVLHVGLLGVSIADKPSRIYVGKQEGAILSIDTSTKKVLDKWSLANLSSLSAFAFVPVTGNSSGYFYVASSLSDFVNVYAIPQIKSSSLLAVHTTFVPVPMARSISAIAFLPGKGLLVNSGSPKALILYGIKEGLPTSVVRVLSGFDTKNVIAIAHYSDSQVLVQSADSMKVMLYHQDSTLFTYADCLKTR